MEYIKFDNDAKKVDIFGGDKRKLEKADFDFAGSTLQEVKVEGKFVTLIIKNQVNTVTLELNDAKIMNLKVSSDKKYLIQGIEYANTEKKVFLTLALENYSDFRFACKCIEVVSVEK